MSFPKIKEILASEFSEEDLALEISKVKRQIFMLRLKQRNRQPVKSHMFKHSHHKLAQLLMIQHVRFRANSNYINYLQGIIKPLPKKLDLHIKSKDFKKE